MRAQLLEGLHADPAALLERLAGIAAERPLEIRVVTRARAVVTESDSAVDRSSFVVLRTRGADGWLSGVASTDSAVGVAAALLDEVSGSAAPNPRLTDPILWCGGSGGVLLHEAIGHPSEQTAAPLRWPEWLEVADDPHVSGLGSLREEDDCGVAPRRALLHLGQSPCSWRRATYRDVPARRMTNLVASHHDAPFDLPARRIEVRFVRAGSWDALTDEVTLDVAVAELVVGRQRRRLAPFRFSETRERVATRLAGASGAALRYPGVVCSKEGMPLPVGTVAADLLMAGPRP